MKQIFRADLAARAVRNRIWRYLRASASPLDVAPIAEDLFGLPRGELRRLTAASIAREGSTREMLKSAAQLLRELPSSVERAEVELVGLVRPPVAWDKTARRRWTTGDPTRFICRPAERRYDTPLTRLVVLALSRGVSLAEIAALDPAGRTG